MYNITIFNAQKNNTKFAWSPYDDKTFVFENHQVKTNRELYNVIVSHWILNIPLPKLPERVRSFRRKNVLENFYDENIEYFVIDLDEVMTKEAQEYLLEYFKEYKCIIGESRGFNGKDNFNMKGFLFINPVKIEDSKRCIASIHQILKEYCVVDQAVARKATFNAPIGKNNILLNNESGKLYECKIKPQEYSTEVQETYTGEAIDIDVNNITGDTIEELCLNTFKNMGFDAMRRNENESLTFKHPSEVKSPGGYFWFSQSPYTMHHANSTKTINIFDSIRKTDKGKELMQKTIDYDDAFLNFNTDTQVISVNEKYLMVEGKEEELATWLHAKNGLLSIKSPMGTGKSTIINYVIEEAHEVDMKVLIITNRRSVAADFAKKYSMKLYSKDKYNRGDSLIVQYDSLWKYNIKDFDIVIMDEFISLMMHSRSSLNSSSINLAKFFGAFNKKLVIADAFLTGYENFLLNNKKTNILQIENTWRDKTILQSYENSNYFVQELLFQSKNNKITVSSTSLNFLNSVRLILEKRGLKVITLTADTPDSTKELVYELFEKDNHDKWDVFMYSPTLTVGVSNLNEVPYHFHYDSSMSTDVISSIQMIKRTRKAREIHMFIKEHTKYLKTTYDSVRDEYMANMGRNIEQNYLFDIDDYGEAKLSKVGRNAVKIDTFKNILEFDHKAAMFWLIKYHFLHEPRISTEVLEGSILAGPSKALKENKALIMDSNITEFLHMNEVEKTDILMGNDSGAIMRTLAEIDNAIQDDVDNNIRTKILNIAMLNKSFVSQCRYYKDTYNYGLKLSNTADIKSKISEAVINGNHADLNFYNALIKRGPERILPEYQKTKIEDGTLKYILDKIGYKNQVAGLGTRSYSLLKDVKDYYGYIK